MGLKILQRKRVPRFTITGDGLPGDPVNLALTGTLRAASRRLRRGRLGGGGPAGLASSWRMVRAFVLNKPLPDRAVQHALPLRARPGHRLPEGDRRQPAQAPSRPLLGAEPRARASRPSRRRASGSTPTGPPEDERVLWVGAGTRDTGLLAHLADLPDHARHRCRHQCGARLHRRRVEQVRGHRRRDLYQTGDHWRPSMSITTSPTARSPWRR